MDMKKIQPGYLAQQAADRIRDMIRNGSLKKGDRIREEPMCAAMGVSRTPLREALRILSSEGLIESIPNRGSYVAQPTIEAVGEMFFVMSVLEGTCARLCAEKLDEKGLRRMDVLYRKLEQHCSAENREKYMAVNHSFHSLVQELAGNKVLSQAIDGLRQKILLYRYRQIYQPHRLKESMQEHRDLQQAFRERRPDAAEVCMREHLTRQFLALKTVLAEASEHPRGDSVFSRNTRRNAAERLPPKRKEVPASRG
jgi:DNA-binding GntR family transcriptional regulator